MAAEEVFAARGFGNTSLRDLLAAAGCSTTAFYSRFASKEAVLETLVRELLEDLHDAAARALPQTGSVRDGWKRGIDLLVESLAGRRGLVRVALTDGAQVCGPREALRDEYALLAALLSAQLSAVAKKSKRKISDPEALAWAIVGALTMQVTRWAVFETLDDAALADALLSTANALMPSS